MIEHESGFVGRSRHGLGRCLTHGHRHLADDELSWLNQVVGRKRR